MTDPPLPYYPPRAGFFRRFRRLQYAVKRATPGLVAHAASSRTAVQLLPTLLIPVWGFIAGGSQRLARLALAAYGICLLAYLAFLGQPAANLAGGVAVAVHGIGITYCLNRRDVLDSLRARIIVAVGVVVLLIPCLYIPANRALAYAVYPVRAESGAMVINPRISVEDLRRGDIVVFHIRGRASGGAWLREGLGLEPVLGLPGDVIRFRETHFEVNGVPQPSLPGMPASGTRIVPEGHWFIWTSGMPGGYDLDAATRLRVAASIVPQSDIVGQAFNRWFWREQSYEPVQ